MPIDQVPQEFDASPTYTLESLQSLDVDSVFIDKADEIKPLRRETLTETALEIGAQGGLLSQSRKINQFLANIEDELSQRFPFYSLLIDGEILPPVILSSRQAVTSSDNGKTIRVADATFKIKSDARFVTAAPTWRDYLKTVEHNIEIPHQSIAPNTDAEKALWHAMVKVGWESGVAQADEVHELALNELRQDFLGMVTYRKLLAEGKISKPKIARNNLGVTGNAREMAIGDSVKQITADSALQVNNVYEWKAAVLPDEKPAIISIGQPIEDMHIEVAKTNRVLRLGDVRHMLMAWKEDWESGDPTRYLSHYSSVFVLPESLSREAWEASRRASISRTQKIDLSFDDLDVVMGENKVHASVSFTQRYAFDQYKGEVKKILLLDLSDHGEWVIAYEAESGKRKGL